MLENPEIIIVFHVTASVSTAVYFLCINLIIILLLIPPNITLSNDHVPLAQFM